MPSASKTVEYQPTLGFMIANLELNLRRLENMAATAMGDRKADLIAIRAKMAALRSELEELV